MTGGVLKDPVLLAALAAATAGLALALFPPPLWEIAPFAFDAPAGAASIAPEIAGEAAADLTRLAQFLELTDLPPPTPPVVPPPDPAAALKRFRYLGGAAAEGRQRALFDGDGLIRSLAPGETLEGFALIRIERDGAVFLKEDLEVILPLIVP